MKYISPTKMRISMESSQKKNNYLFVNILSDDIRTCVYYYILLTRRVEGRCGSRNLNKWVMGGASLSIIWANNNLLVSGTTSRRVGLRESWTRDEPSFIETYYYGRHIDGYGTINRCFRLSGWHLSRISRYHFINHDPLNSCRP